ncbi:uncharacterized protein MYCFIDRAFT_180009 [Pseudocercospora fijiensis CIRAD86]|uniref:Uncharacterized protein n=1 Tax=Pseudocercospora fijiensis (strain CIRAD86) TaxID=383855 RepID=M3AIZ1_PSEFD|nr:uncharacterized protein MYCFIDRAFT_180009 [Pseudocercospora fijiensis CIRAD86]EME77447.1 hypothetical protein MYCFIDRAFT_180009 [Pseudocercospora fijiensis CIRAD86]
MTNKFALGLLRDRSQRSGIPKSYQSTGAQSMTPFRHLASRAGPDDPTWQLPPSQQHISFMRRAIENAICCHCLSDPGAISIHAARAPQTSPDNESLEFPTTMAGVSGPHSALLRIRDLREGGRPCGSRVCLPKSVDGPPGWDQELRSDKRPPTPSFVKIIFAQASHCCLCRVHAADHRHYSTASRNSWSPFCALEYRTINDLDTLGRGSTRIDLPVPRYHTNRIARLCGDRSCSADRRDSTDELLVISYARPKLLMMNNRNYPRQLARDSQMRAKYLMNPALVVCDNLRHRTYAPRIILAAGVAWELSSLRLRRFTKRSTRAGLLIDGCEPLPRSTSIFLDTRRTQAFINSVNTIVILWSYADPTNITALTCSSGTRMHLDPPRLTESVPTQRFREPERPPKMIEILLPSSSATSASNHSRALARTLSLYSNPCAIIDILSVPYRRSRFSTVSQEAGKSLLFVRDLVAVVGQAYLQYMLRSSPTVHCLDLTTKPSNFHFTSSSSPPPPSY